MNDYFSPLPSADLKEDQSLHFPCIMADTDKESTNVPRNQRDNIMSQSQSRVQRLSNAVEKTVDKLSKSVSVTSSPSRVFSINRKPRSSHLLSESEGE